MTDKIVVLSTCASEEEARRLAHHLVEKRVAACVNILSGARSVYRWKDADGKDKIEDTAEFVLVIKSRRDLFDALRSEIEGMHSYEVPEVIALAVVDGSERYLEWIDGSLQPG
jgi:periplasmic divalent cation tolerance protein